MTGKEALEIAYTKAFMLKEEYEAIKKDLEILETLKQDIEVCKAEDEDLRRSITEEIVKREYKNSGTGKTIRE